VWTGNHNDREDERETGHSNDAIRNNTGKVQKQKNNGTKQTKQTTTKPVTNGKKSEKKSSKEEV
jgi:phosphatidate phosphatase APP1